MFARIGTIHLTIARLGLAALVSTALSFSCSGQGDGADAGSEACREVGELSDITQLEASCNPPALGDGKVRTFIDLAPSDGGCPDWCDGSDAHAAAEQVASEAADACGGSVEFVELQCGREFTPEGGDTGCFYVVDYELACP